MKKPKQASVANTPAHAAAPGWDVAVTPAPGAGAWCVEIEGPQAYLVFETRDLAVLSSAQRFFQSGVDGTWKKTRDALPPEGLHLGAFGHAAVALIWDDEDFPRSFLIIGPRARSTLRLTFEADDIRMLSAALQQAVNDLNKGKSRSAKVKKP
ncbi:MAG: hypothetical protein U0793_09210 [Gemmataceae bacterium]